MLKIRAPVVEGNLKVGKAREATPSPNNRGSTLRRRLSDDFFHTTPKIESIPLDSLIQRPSGIPRFKSAEICSRRRRAPCEQSYLGRVGRTHGKEKRRI